MAERRPRRTNSPGRPTPESRAPTEATRALDATSEDRGKRLHDRAVLLLIGGMSAASAAAYCQQFGGVDLDTAHKIVARARRQITQAADYVRDEQLGKAISRLEDLFAKATSAKDHGAALRTQREIHKLLGLYPTGATAGGDSADAREELSERLDLIAQHLLPLNLADERYPLEEHARIAAEKLRALL